MPINRSWLERIIMRSLVFFVMTFCMSVANAGGGHAHGNNDHSDQTNHASENLIRLTQFADQTEAYVTFKPLVKGKNTEFSVYVTQLKDYTPLETGIVNVYLEQDGQTKARFRVKQSLKPGLFLLNVAPRSQGEYLLRVTIEAKDFYSEYDFGLVKVFSNLQQAESQSIQNSGDIAYAKQQQWDNPFALGEAKIRPLRASVSGFATVQAPPQNSAIIRAPSDGYYSTTQVINAGSSVQANQLLGYLVPRFGEGADYGDLIVAQEKARSQYQLALADEKRLKDLLNKGAIPEQRYETAQQALEVARIELKTAQSRIKQRMQHSGQTGIALRAPISGIVLQSHVGPGSFLEEGETLFSISGDELRWLSINIPEKFASSIEQITGVEFQFNGQYIQLNTEQGARVAEIHQQIDPTTRTMKVALEYPSHLGPKYIGKRFAANVFVQEKQLRLSIPSSAIIDDNGRPVVYVQTSGEFFTRRNVELGIQDGQWVEVKSGIVSGDRVVSQGAYLVKLASTGSDSIGHGHAH